MLKGHALKPSRITLLKILMMLEDPSCKVSVLEELITQDVTLSYKILRFVNSSFYGVRKRISSVKQAVVSLGLKTIRDWFIIISLTNIDDKPRELIFLILQRARIMQMLSSRFGLSADTCFTTGLFSSLDAIMDQPMEVLLEALPLCNDISKALLLREGKLGDLLSLVIHYEKGEWDTLEEKYLEDCPLTATDLNAAYFEAMAWASGLVQAS